MDILNLVPEGKIGSGAAQVFDNAQMAEVSAKRMIAKKDKELEDTKKAMDLDYSGVQSKDLPHLMKEYEDMRNFYKENMGAINDPIKNPDKWAEFNRRKNGILQKVYESKLDKELVDKQNAAYQSNDDLRTDENRELVKQLATTSVYDPNYATIRERAMALAPELPDWTTKVSPLNLTVKKTEGVLNNEFTSSTETTSFNYTKDSPEVVSDFNLVLSDPKTKKSLFRDAYAVAAAKNIDPNDDKKIYELARDVHFQKQKALSLKDQKLGVKQDLTGRPMPFDYNAFGSGFGNLTDETFIANSSPTEGDILMYDTANKGAVVNAKVTKKNSVNFSINKPINMSLDKKIFMGAGTEVLRGMTTGLFKPSSVYATYTDKNGNAVGQGYEKKYGKQNVKSRAFVSGSIEVVGMDAKEYANRLKKAGKSDKEIQAIMAEVKQVPVEEADIQSLLAGGDKKAAENKPQFKISVPAIVPADAVPFPDEIKSQLRQYDKTVNKLMNKDGYSYIPMSGTGLGSQNKNAKSSRGSFGGEGAASKKKGLSDGNKKLFQQ